MSAPDVSIVIATYQSERTLPALLEACAAQDLGGELELVVVDDGSTDASPRLAEAAGARVIRQENAGPAAARNHGWGEARAPIVLFTDADCVPRADWARLLSAAVDHATPVAGGSYGIANPGSWLAETIHAEILWRHARMPEEVEFAGSFNLGATRAALESVGGFDEAFPAPSGEDNDLSYRLRDAGHRIRFMPDALVEHHHPTALGRYLREQARHGEWRVILYARHPGRVRGDGYAGPAEFAAPPVAILSVVAGVAALAVPDFRLPASVLGVASLLFVILLHTALAVRVARLAGATTPLALAGVGALRAYARGWGLLKGVARLLTGRTRS